MKQTFFLFAALIVAAAFLLSCGGNADEKCSVAAQMTPASTTIDHLAAPPANSQTFRADRIFVGSCVQAQVLPVVTWTSSDPTNAPVTPGTIGQNSALAVATCNAAAGATITATFDGNLGATATLTCK
jgi:hypothetical protein